MVQEDSTDAFSTLEYALLIIVMVGLWGLRCS